MAPAALSFTLFTSIFTSPSLLCIEDPAPGLFAHGEVRTIALNPIEAPADWAEMVPTWNVDNAENCSIKVEARVVYSDSETKYYSLGNWVKSRSLGSRASLDGQGDEDGNVLTDTLRMVKPGGKVQMRLTGRAWPTGPLPKFKRIFLSFTGASAPAAIAPRLMPIVASRLLVPQLLQGDFPNGKGLCSPTCVSMLLHYWSQKLGDPSLAIGVSTVEHFVYDPVYEGAGNWTFNCSFAGSLPGLAACVARLEGLGSLDTWCRRGVPVVCSVSWYLLHGQEIQADEQGHLIVVVGFDSDGNVVIQDPGDRQSPLRPVAPDTFLRAWNHSKRTSYLIGPERLILDSPEIARIRPST